MKKKARCTRSMAMREACSPMTTTGTMRVILMTVRVEMATQRILGASAGPRMITLDAPSSVAATRAI